MDLPLTRIPSAGHAIGNATAILAVFVGKGDRWQTTQGRQSVQFRDNIGKIFAHWSQSAQHFAYSAPVKKRLFCQTG